MAFCTVTGLTPFCATSSRFDGSCAPGAAERIQFWSPADTRSVLSLDMSDNSSATLLRAPVLSSRAGLSWGLLGVTAFSFTVPFTRIAVGTLSPLFIGSARAVVAAVLAALVLILMRQRWPHRAQWARLTIVAGGVVIGFPMLTSYALDTASASHGAMVIGILPAATAIVAVMRGRERPARSFWVFAALGAVAAVVFASLQGGGFGQLVWSDLLLFGAVLAAAFGYAEGGLLSRELGSWQTICWALVLAAPVMIIFTAIAVAQQSPSGGPAEWLSFAYLAVISMFLGFFAWYRGLAIGPIAQVSQVQLVQPVMSILWAAVILHEDVGLSTALGGFSVIVCAGLAVRTRLYGGARR